MEIILSNMEKKMVEKAAGDTVILLRALDPQPVSCPYSGFKWKDYEVGWFSFPRLYLVDFPYGRLYGALDVDLPGYNTNIWNLEVTSIDDVHKTVATKIYEDMGVETFEEAPGAFGIVQEGLTFVWIIYVKVSKCACQSIVMSSSGRRTFGPEGVDEDIMFFDQCTKCGAKFNIEGELNE